jgi:ATP phosphoribosyltransferase
MAVYNERLAIPKKIVHEVDQTGLLGSEILEERETRDGVVRDLEANLIMDLEVAKSMLVWLAEKAAELEGRKFNQSSSVIREPS